MLQIRYIDTGYARELVHSPRRIGAELSGVPGFPFEESGTSSVRSITSTGTGEKAEDESLEWATRLRRGWLSSDSSESEQISWDVRQKVRVQVVEMNSRRTHNRATFTMDGEGKRAAQTTPGG